MGTDTIDEDPIAFLFPAARRFSFFRRIANTAEAARIDDVEIPSNEVRGEAVGKVPGNSFYDFFGNFGSRFLDVNSMEKEFFVGGLVLFSEINFETGVSNLFARERERGYSVSFDYKSSSRGSESRWPR